MRSRANGAELTVRRRRMIIVTAALAIAVWAVGRLLGLITQQAGLPCVFRLITGFACPGCGNTRALIALSGGDPALAWRLNRLFPLEAAYLLWVYLHAAAVYVRSGRFCYTPRRPWAEILVLAALLVWWPLRNYLGI